MIPTRLQEMLMDAIAGKEVDVATIDYKIAKLPMDDDTEKVLGELSKVFAKTIVNKDDNYCTEENCEIYDNDLSCERCNK